VKVKKGHYTFEGEEWKDISADAKDIISKCLNTDPTKRISAEQILEHNWFKAELNATQQLPQQNKKFLNNYSKYCKFKKII